MKQLIKSLSTARPDVTFISGEVFSWSPTDKRIYYSPEGKSPEVAKWSLLHEFSHALLQHDSYTTDLELLLMESAAWDKAKALSSDYECAIDDEHIQDCLDTYRDWLHARSSCPACDQVSIQSGDKTYLCINCKQQWRVSDAKFRRPYRLCLGTNLSQNKTSPEPNGQAMFY